jgi:2,5-dihydroxypyridine 5,6-dioxygenase
MQTLNDVIDHIIINCGGLTDVEDALVVYDVKTSHIAELFVLRGKQLGLTIESIETPLALRHGTEPAPSVAAKMLEPDLCFGLTTMSLAHTDARLALSRRGGRYLSLPEYSDQLLRDPSIMVDYRARAPLVRRVADLLTKAAKLRVTSALGTDIECDILGRQGNYCPGFVEYAGDLGSPPDIESNISPVESGSNGVIVVDGSIPCPEVGLLPTPVKLTVKNGAIIKFESADPELADTVRALFERVGNDRAYILAECGIGLNDKAKLTGVMLTDEGAYGNIHFGFGSNATVGGKNKVPFHLDFVCCRASLDVDGKRIMEYGNLVI